MDERKIYSLNLLAYLIKNNVKLQYFKDNDGKIYATADEDVGRLIKEYKEDIELHKFLNSFAIIKNNMKEIYNNDKE